MIFSNKNSFAKTLKHLVFICASLLALVGGALHAEPYFIHKDGAMVLDKATGMIWMRCSLGQSWDGKTCSGEADAFTFARALNARSQAGGFTDWKLPTIRELSSLIFCSNGRANFCSINDQRPAINVSVFPIANVNVKWRSSSINELDSRGNSAWMINFANGSQDVATSNQIYLVRLVRAQRVADSDALLDFIPLDAWLEREKQLLDTEHRRLSIKRENEERIFSAVMNAEEPQSMYLAAGKYVRMGERFRAIDIYTKLIDRFPASPLAVKASDELTRLQHSPR